MWKHLKENTIIVSTLLQIFEEQKRLSSLISVFYICSAICHSVMVTAECCMQNIAWVERTMQNESAMLVLRPSPECHISCTALLFCDLIIVCVGAYKGIASIKGTV